MTSDNRSDKEPIVRNRPEQPDHDHSQRGAVASEYAVLLSILAAALVVSVGALSGAITAALNATAGVIN